MIDQSAANAGTIARPTAAACRQRGLVPPHPPGDDEKYLYIERNLLYLTTVIFIGSCCLIYSQIRLETHDLLLAPFLLFTVVYVLYQLISLPVNFAGRGFDLAGHRARVSRWRPAGYPSVDIYLPICGEPAALLANTWAAVSALIAAYPGAARAYVLDDGPSGEAMAAAAASGFGYLRRPEPRAGKKSGNLRWAFARTDGEV